MALRQGVLIRQELAAQLLRAGVVVVQVDLDFAVASAAQLGQGFQVLRPILLHGVEKGVPRRTAITIPEPAEQPGIVLNPAANACPRHLGRHLAVFGFVVVREAQ
jgi:hypothetical protein